MGRLFFFFMREPKSLKRVGELRHSWESKSTLLDVSDPPNAFLSFHKGTRSKGCESVTEDDVSNVNSGREIG